MILDLGGCEAIGSGRGEGSKSWAMRVFFDVRRRNLGMGGVIGRMHFEGVAISFLCRIDWDIVYIV